jgi:hypothetical protein
MKTKMKTNLTKAVGCKPDEHNFLRVGDRRSHAELVVICVCTKCGQSLEV